MRKKTSRSAATKFVLFILYISAVFITIELVVMGISALIDGQINGVKPLLIASVAAFLLYRIGKKKVQPLLDKLPIKSRSSKKDAPTSSSPAKPAVSAQPTSKAATPAKAAATAKPAVTPAPATTVATGPKYEHIHIKVAGVTFSNNDGTDRQQLLRKIKYGKAPFEDNDNLDVALKAQTFTNSDGIEEPAVGVYVNEYQIGFIPKDLIKDILYALDQPTATITAIDISGGGTHNGTKYPYGCKVVIRYEK